MTETEEIDHQERPAKLRRVSYTEALEPDGEGSLGGVIAQLAEQPDFQLSDAGQSPSLVKPAPPMTD